MRKKYIKNARFYSVLESISQCPDKTTTEPYYFDNFENFDLFLVFYRENDPFRIFLLLYRKDLQRRNSFSNTFQVLKVEIPVENFYFCLFDSNIYFLIDFIKYLQIENDIVKDTLYSLESYDISLR